MTANVFLFFYTSTILVIVACVLLIRIYQLRPLLHAKKCHATIVSNHHNRGALSQIGVLVEGVGTVMHIQPPAYVKDELLTPESSLHVWITPELPGVLLTRKPDVFSILLKAFKPCLLLLFLFLLPAVFIAKGVWF